MLTHTAPQNCTGAKDYLLNNNFTCPGCFRPRISPEALIANNTLRDEIKAFVEKYAVC